MKKVCDGRSVGTISAIVAALWSRTWSTISCCVRLFGFALLFLAKAFRLRHLQSIEYRTCQRMLRLLTCMMLVLLCNLHRTSMNQCMWRLLA